jgi:hypothetical protein
MSKPDSVYSVIFRLFRRSSSMKTNIDGDKNHEETTCDHLSGWLAGLFALNCQRGTGPADGRPTIALVVKTLNNPFFNDMQKGAEEAAASCECQSSGAGGRA